MTRLLDAEVTGAIWQTIEPLLPRPDSSHPLGCHRRRASDRLCIRGPMIRLVTGSSWEDIETVLDHQVSDRTPDKRRNDWTSAGILDALCAQALARFKSGSQGCGGGGRRRVCPLSANRPAC